MLPRSIPQLINCTLCRLTSPFNNSIQTIHLSPVNVVKHLQSNSGGGKVQSWMRTIIALQIQDAHSVKIWDIIEPSALNLSVNPFKTVSKSYIHLRGGVVITRESPPCNVYSLFFLVTVHASAAFSQIVFDINRKFTKPWIKSTLLEDDVRRIIKVYRPKCNENRSSLSLDYTSCH